MNIGERDRKNFAAVCKAASEGRLVLIPAVESESGAERLLFGFLHVEKALVVGGHDKVTPIPVGVFWSAEEYADRVAAHEATPSDAPEVAPPKPPGLILVGR